MFVFGSAQKSYFTEGETWDEWKTANNHNHTNVATAVVENGDVKLEAIPGIPWTMPWRVCRKLVVVIALHTLEEASPVAEKQLHRDEEEEKEDYEEGT